MTNSVLTKIQKSKTEATKNIAKLDALSPLKTLARGYSIVQKNGKVVKSVNELNKDDIISLRLADGIKMPKLYNGGYNMDFEEIMKKLEEITAELEKGELTLDESVKKFEEGIKLSKECSKILEDSEKRINILINNDGNISEENFLPEEG